MSSVTKRPGGRWRARFRDQSGREHARHFDRKVDAQRWIDEVTASTVRGDYVDPRAGRETVRELATRWRATLVHRPNSLRVIDNALGNHIVPAFGDRPLSTLRRIAARADQAAVPPHDRGGAADTAGVGRARRRHARPIRGFGGPAGGHWAADQRSPRAPGPRCELPQSQAAVSGQRDPRTNVFVPTKTRSSVRSVPLGQVVVDVLAAHLARYPAADDGSIFATNRDDH